VKSIDKLKKAKDLSGLAKLLGYQPKAVSFIIYIIPDADKYDTFKIPKKDGGEREIQAPVPRLKELQRRLADLLQHCLEDVYGREAYGRSLSHGFRKGHSIITNASNHKNRRYVFNVDLKDFFPSINFGRVRGFFIKSNDFELDPKVATVIAQIACHGNALPQGSPVSPVISNLIGHILDIRLVKLAKKAKCGYSRYADDITFSTRAKNFPALIAKKEPTGEWLPSDKLDTAIKRAGFEINTKKVSMQYWTQRQMATGLVVNRKVNIRASYYRQARAMSDALFRTGQFYIGKAMQWGEPKDSPAKVLGTVNQLKGVLSFIYSVKKHHDERDIKKKWKKPTAIHKLYRRFLYFDKFHALQMPFVFCEGKTDSVYIKCAIKALPTTYPGLINNVGGNVTFLIDFFKYSKMNMDLMQFSGGTGDLAAFIHHYKKMMQPFLCKGRKFPVIVLIDNDAGAEPVLKKASKITGGKVDGGEEFYHLSENLYLVVLPKTAGTADVVIEDFFESRITTTVINGKTFNPDEKTFDKDKHYGKQVFAEKVIKASQKSINFDSFKPILDRLEAAIADHAGKLATP